MIVIFLPDFDILQNYSFSKFSSEKKMKYFIQAIPASMKKHLMINLKLPDDTSEVDLVNCGRYNYHTLVTC